MTSSSTSTTTEVLRQEPPRASDGTSNGAIAGLAPGVKPDFPLSKGVQQSAHLQLGLKDRLIYWAMLAAVHAFSLLPDFFLYKMGVAGGLLFYLLDKRHVRIGTRNLEIAFPERTDAERRRILRASYINLGRTAAE